MSEPDRTPIWPEILVGGGFLLLFMALAFFAGWTWGRDYTIRRLAPLVVFPQDRPACREEIRVVPLNAPSFCGQNQHRVIVVPLEFGEPSHSMVVHCSCAQEREVTRVIE